MLNRLIRKIISILFFVLISGLILIVFLDNYVDKNINNNIYIYIGIFISSLVLFTLNLLKPKDENVQTPDLNEKIADDPERKKPMTKYMKDQTEKLASEILKDIDKPAQIKSLAELVLKNFAKNFYIVQGIFYIMNKNTERFELTATYAYYSENEIKDFEEGEGITGQVALNKKIQIINDIAEGYITVISGLGSSSPSNLLIIPFIFNNETVAIVELAAFETFPENINEIYNKINDPLAQKINVLI